MSVWILLGILIIIFLYICIFLGENRLLGIFKKGFFGFLFEFYSFFLIMDFLI